MSDRASKYTITPPLPATPAGLRRSYCRHPPGERPFGKQPFYLIISRQPILHNQKDIKLKVDDKVLFAKYTGTEFKLDGVKYLLIECSDVLAK